MVSHYQSWHPQLSRCVRTCCLLSCMTKKSSPLRSFVNFSLIMYLCVIKLFVGFVGLTDCVSPITDAGYPSHAPDADATHASWYGHAPGYEHDARRAPSTWHAHGHRTPRSTPSRPVAGRPAEDGSAESRHSAAAGGEGQTAGEGGAHVNRPHTSYTPLSSHVSCQYVLPPIK